MGCMPAEPGVRCALSLIIAILCLSIVRAETKSCLGRPEVNPKRYLVVNGSAMEFRLGVSRSVTHQIVTQVLYILLTEALGYPSVNIVNSPYQTLSGTFKEHNISYNTLPSGAKWPDNYLNIEVWVPSDINFVIPMGSAKISDIGNIAPPAKYGLFIAVNRNSSLSEEVSWDVFLSPTTAKQYRISSDHLSSFKQYASDKDGFHFCEEMYNCTNGIFTPDHCKNETCAILLSDYSELTGFLTKEIIARKLYLEVAWVGGNLETALGIFTAGHKKGVPVAAAEPGPLTLLRWEGFRLLPVTQLPCHYYGRDAPPRCHFQSHRLAKLVPTNLFSWALPAYETLQAMSFDAQDYLEMLETWQIEITKRSRSSKKAAYNAACEWLKGHEKPMRPDAGNSTRPENYWFLWEPYDQDWNKIFIEGIFPLANSSFQSPEGIVMAANMATQRVKDNRSILRDYTIELKVDNGQCRSDLVLKKFIDHIRNDYFKRVAGILGPACSESIEPLIGVATHYKTMVISYSAEGSSFSREKYPFFFRTIGENKKFKYVYLALMKNLNWTRVASLTKDGTKYAEYISETETLLKEKGIEFIGNRKFANHWQHIGTNIMQTHLQLLKNDRARIIIVDVNDEEARAIMCAAYHLDMLAKNNYVWFLPLWLSGKWYQMDNREKNYNCTTANLLEVINGHFSISHSFYAPDDTLTHENITVAEWRKLYRLYLSGHSESNYAGYAYDAMWTYFYALEKLSKANQTYLSNLHDDNATKNFLRFINETDFQGVSGHISFKEGTIRENPIHIYQWIHNTSRIIGTFHPNSTLDEKGVLFLKRNEIVWLSGHIPDDGKEPQDCLLNSLAIALGASCELAIVALSVGVLTLLLIIGLGGFIFIRYRYEKRGKAFQTILDKIGYIDTNISSLDKWEIPRDMVVINRRLGEGAFGTVYGGEAFFDEKGWVAVAVKTLKLGSTTEEKLDFLSEAELMKRFDHKNIIKLLGVCTKNEPIYNVMEFMLYGDLKTYLLARRHLVNERSSQDTDEVSPKKLTQMALDVARALSYLAENRYVHRDVASRNCLVNSQRVVKLGDFGMTRAMFSSDYYKFTRKGMLPVRWMAPESLGLGVYTPASDVWSYGVLLYEIITFGSFPFQGLSNNQVLEHVKLGNTLTVPEGIKPQLESLLRSCWRIESRERPQAKDIVEIIANNPRLLAPCLDIPIKSVQMEDTGQLEISMERNNFGIRRRSGTNLVVAAAISGLRRASASSLGGVIVPNEPTDGSVTHPLLPNDSTGMRFFPLRDLDTSDCNHTDSYKDSIL